MSFPEDTHPSKEGWKRFLEYVTSMPADELAFTRRDLDFFGLPTGQLRRHVGRRPVELPQAERALLAVHRAEQAALLREAAEIQLALRPSRRVLLGARAAAQELAQWRRRCSEEVRFARADGADVSVVLLVVCKLPTSRWPGARELALVSLSLAAHPEAQLTALRALLAGGDAEGALEELRRCTGMSDPALRARAFLARASVSEMRGELEEALVFFDRALHTQVPGVRRKDPYLGLLVLTLALALGDEERASAARGLVRAACARRVEPPVPRALRGEPPIAVTDAWADLEGRLGAWRRRLNTALPESSARHLFELLCDPNEATRRVAWLFLGS